MPSKVRILREKRKESYEAVVQSLRKITHMASMMMIDMAESKKFKGKVEKVMHEYKHAELHSGSKKGPKVKSRAQAIAIALNEARNK